MITRLIAETLTPIVSKSRFLKLRGARGVISNRPYINIESPTHHGCHTTLVVKQGAHGFPVYRRAHSGYLHLDFKAHTSKQARRKLKIFLQLQCVGEFTTWGYGRICWIIQKSYHDQKAIPPLGPRFRILKGLPPNLKAHEYQLIMAALLHDMVDTDLHPSKLGWPVKIPNSYVQWLCEHHHNSRDHPENLDLNLLQEADARTSRHARLLHQPTPRRKLLPLNTQQFVQQLEKAAQCSVYKLYSFIYHSKELRHLTASKVHPTETLRNHLIGVANWTLFLLRTWASASQPASAALAGQPGVTPGPVEMEDPRDRDEPLASW